MSISPLSVTRQYMLAASVPALKGQELCSTLSRMDELESRVLDQEEGALGDLLKKMDNNPSLTDIFFQTLAVGLGVTGITGGVMYARIANDVPEPAPISWNQERTVFLESHHAPREAQRTANLRRESVNTTIISSLMSMFAFFALRISDRYSKKML